MKNKKVKIKSEREQAPPKSFFFFFLDVLFSLQTRENFFMHQLLETNDLD